MYVASSWADPLSRSPNTRVNQDVKSAEREVTYGNVKPVGRRYIPSALGRMDKLQKERITQLYVNTVYDGQNHDKQGHRQA